MFSLIDINTLLYSVIFRMIYNYKYGISDDFLSCGFIFINADLYIIDTIT